MDDLVKAAMAKWPDVPAVHGWLELTSRGEWRIRGEPIDNEAICAFIGRNYASDAHGNWFFQNGPQRVFVSLEATPIVYRLDESGRLQAHTGAYPRELRGAFADPEGRLFLDTDLGPGLVDSQDTVTFADRLVDAQGRQLDEHGLDRWNAGAGDVYLAPAGFNLKHDCGPIPLAHVPSGNWAAFFGFVARPGGDEAA
jgi:Protein of unknown function (DUF2946)